MNIRPCASPARLAAAAGACLALAAPAHAIVSTTASSNGLGGSLAEALDGEARLVINGSTGCSGTLLAGGAYVLTAAHCVTDKSGVIDASSIALSFNSGSVTASVSSASQISVYSGWDGKTLGENDDLALLKLDNAVTTVSGYALYTTDPIGQTVLLTGYGLTGLGSSGAVSGSFGTLHYGYNEYEAYYVDANGSILYDFDNGTRQNNVFGSLGLGTDEAMIASGDSGGGSFVYLSGQLYLVGVHSFGGQTSRDIDAALNSSFGEIGADTLVYSTANLSWIEAVSGVPELSTWALWLTGLGAVGGWKRRAIR